MRNSAIPLLLPHVFGLFSGHLTQPEAGALSAGDPGWTPGVPTNLYEKTTQA